MHRMKFSIRFDDGNASTAADDAFDQEEDQEVSEKTWKSTGNVGAFKPFSETAQRLALEVLMDLDAEEIPSLREEFASFKGSALPLADFVRIIKSHLKVSDRKDIQIVSDLCELFAEIDFNGDGTVEWDEFTTFLIESAKVQHFSVNRIKEYLPVATPDEAVEETYVRGFSFPDWDFTIFCGKKKKIKVINPADFSTVFLCDHNASVISSEYVAKRDTLLFSSSDMVVSLWDATTFQKKSELPGVDVTQSSLRWHSKKNTLLCGSRSGSITCWDLDSMSCRGELNCGATYRPHTDSVTEMQVIGRDQLLATVSQDSRLLIWDLKRGEIVDEYTDHKEGINGMAFSNEFYFLVTIGFERDAFVWIPNTRTSALRLRDPKRPHLSTLMSVFAVKSSPQIVTADTLGQVKVWDLRNFQCVQTFGVGSTADIDDRSPAKGKKVNISSIVYSERSKRIIASGRRFHAFRYENEGRPDVADDFPIVSAMFNSETCTFVTASNRSIRIWDANSGVLIQLFNNVTDHEITTMCLDDRQRKLFVGTHGGELKCFNYANGGFVKEYNAHKGEVSCIVYCGRSRRLISTSWDGRVRILDDRDSCEGITLKQLPPMHFGKRGHRSSPVEDREESFGELKCVAYGLKQSLFAVGGATGIVRIWEYSLKRTTLLATHEDHDSEIACMIFLGSFPLLVDTDGQGHINVYSCRPHPNSLVTQWQNEKVNLLSPTVLCMAFDESDRSLYTGDEKGNVTVYDMSDIISSLEDESVMREVPRKIHNFKAHEDGILSVTLISEPQCIITSGYDCQVRLWSKEGKSYGGLHQGRLSEKEMEKDPFSFSLNKSKQQSKATRKVKDVLRKLNFAGRVVRALTTVRMQAKNKNTLPTDLDTFLTQQKT